ncbi:hypothetical protein WG66_000814 [Moniliophthora roreri]|nr:hypothetical protein WG66_000814 [Moniliophthora roreri]
MARATLLSFSIIFRSPRSSLIVEIMKLKILDSWLERKLRRSELAKECLESRNLPFYRYPSTTDFWYILRISRIQLVALSK